MLQEKHYQKILITKLTESKIQFVIDHLIEITNHIEVEDSYENSVIIQSKRFKKLKNDERDAQISPSDYDIEENKLVRSLIDLIRETHRNGYFSKVLMSKLKFKFFEMLSDEQVLHFIKQEQEQKKEQVDQIATHLTEDDILNITKTAIILLDIDKIKYKYDEHKWPEIKIKLDKFHQFENHSNEKVAGAIFEELLHVSNKTRYGMTSDVAYSMESLIWTFFPASYEKETEKRLANGKLCISICFGLIYDAILYLNDLSITVNGLYTLKFLYRKGKERDMPELMEEVLKTYKELEDSLNRPERKDLEDGNKLVQIFKADLDNPSLSWPVLPKYLFDLVK